MDPQSKALFPLRRSTVPDKIIDGKRLYIHGKGLSLQAFLSERLYNLIVKAMKKGLHPETYRLVAFKDMSNETVFITRSCAETKETLMVDGVEYPVVKVEISNTSHPFYTGKVKLVDTAGRVDKFYQRYKDRRK